MPYGDSFVAPKPIPALRFAKRGAQQQIAIKNAGFELVHVVGEAQHEQVLDWIARKFFVLKIEIQHLYEHS